ncbi:TPA: rubrerythrin family protein [Candidatus Woesearchaeota archaeon]|nr:rubrerythrin family protein [Candidatus Woesearchaeota archaeon]
MKLLQSFQKNEITEHIIYTILAKKLQGTPNAKILRQIANDEERHYRFWRQYTKRDIKPKMFRVFWYTIIASLLGLSFGLKLMEQGEVIAAKALRAFKGKLPGINEMIGDEQKHEVDLLKLMPEEKLEYAGSVVLGLNDALVELTGALAGLTFALQNARIIGFIGAITGFAASFSMAASHYLSTKEEAEQNTAKSPLKGALYTGIAYILTVTLLVAPYFVLQNVFSALAMMMGIAITVIACYTFYITTAKSQRFTPRFLEMALISLGVAAATFLVGVFIRSVFGIDI